MFRGAGGDVEGYLAITRDITARKRAEEMLLVYRRTIEMSPDLISMVNRSYRYVSTNEAFLRYRGFTREQVEGRTIPEVLGEKMFRETVKPAIDRALLGEDLRCEYEDEYTMGHCILDEAYIPFRDAKGNIEGVVLISRDITELKHHEREIANIAKFPLENPNPVYRVGTDGILLYSNPAGDDFLGEYGCTVGGTAPEFLWEAARESLERGTIRTIEIGGPRIFSMRVVPIAGAGYANVYATDITEQKQLQERYLQSQKMETVARLAGGIAHDFNNIITAILGYVKLIELSLPENNSLREDLNEIEKASHRGAELTRQLLAFSRRQIIEPKVVDLNDTLAALDRMLRRLIGEDVELITHLDTELWMVKVDPGQVEQALTNLAVNARDAMPDGGTLTIETRNARLDEQFAAVHAELVPGEYVMLAVSDTGVGMTDEVKMHAFEPFFTTKEQGKGTGLGLATVHGIVKQAGGHVWLYSEECKGTTVKIYLPRVKDESAERKSPENHFVHRGGETILLVEDEAAVLRMTSRVLREAGYTVLEATNGEEALRVLEQTGNLVDVAVTDVIMPRMRGKEFAERAKILRPDMKILFISGYTDDAIAHRGVLDEGVEFLHKPFSLADLTKKIRNLLGGG